MYLTNNSELNSFGLGERLEFDRWRLEEDLDDEEPKTGFIVIGIVL